MNLIKGIIKYIGILGIALFAQASHSVNSLLEQARALQNHDPLKAIQLLKTHDYSLETSSEQVFFDAHVLLAELLLKTEKFNHANQVVDILETRYSEEQSFQPRLAILKSHVLIIRQKTEKVMSLLTPFKELYTSEGQPELNAWYLFLVGSLQVRDYNFAEAMRNLTEALDKSRQYKMLDLELSIQNELVQIFYYTKKYSKAIELSDELLSFSKTIKDQYLEVGVLSDKMNIYYLWAVEIYNKLPPEVAAQNEDYRRYMDESNRLQQELMQLSKEIGAYRTMIKGLIISLNNKLTENKYREAVAIGERVLKVADEQNLMYSMAITSNNMAIAYREIGEFDKSIEKLKDAENYYKEIQDIQSLTWVYEDYTLTYQKAGDFEQAFSYQKKYQSALLELMKKTSEQSLVALQEEYADKEKSQKILRLTQQSAIDAQRIQTEKMKIWILVLVLIAFSLIALALAQKRKNLKKLLNQEAELNQRITEVNEAKQRFFNNLSHEFKTALTLSISPIKQFLADNQEQPAVSLESALNNNLHMMALLDEVLDIKKMDSKSLPMMVSKINFKQAIDSCLNRFQYQLSEKNMFVEKEGFSDDLNLYFDPSHLEKIIANILSNASKYCGDDCRLSLSLIEHSEHVVLDLIDDGPGIEAAELPHVFTRFYQGKLSASKQKPGTGIGLSMVKELMEMHHGAAEISSINGEGCQVKLIFRKGHDHYSQQVLAKSRAFLDNSAMEINSQVYSLEDNGRHENDDIESVENTKLILVVDDNAEIRNLLCGILQPEYNVLEAENGQQALCIAELKQPDLIIADVMMPEMSGFDLTTNLRKNEKLAHISIMLLTALSKNEQRVHGLLIGADDYLTKPFDNDELLARVRNHLAHKERISTLLLNQYKESLDSKEYLENFSDQQTRRSEQLERLITENLGKCDFDIEQMYSALNMTRSSLYRYTQKVYNCTPMNLLKKRRLEVAHQMLIETAGSISEIAYAVGYQSLASFSRAFRQHYKYPPTKVKKAIPDSQEQTVTQEAI
ncbi:response regulator [Kangiella sp. HZ709]|uniref:response regulator n=1 Tax=Kangiella sp. HZ709 TaxID=2666328 RepID=UPI0012AFC3DE|nr:response regulator [Kangiella sp. HZ709]MRX27033.1 response regulator [Kangiella sp. HZ709]